MCSFNTCERPPLSREAYLLPCPGACLHSSFMWASLRTEVCVLKSYVSGSSGQESCCFPRTSSLSVHSHRCGQCPGCFPLHVHVAPPDAASSVQGVLLKLRVELMEPIGRPSSPDHLSKSGSHPTALLPLPMSGRKRQSREAGWDHGTVHLESCLFTLLF